jgi:2-polyprenyl-6-methoxyphenol hydroxylase-like FAD-dependent oxidoreductase
MNSYSHPLIVGAGPVGLAAAVFLARNGVQTRIIDSAAGPSPQSKALAVNPRTLELLEPTGVTADMLAIGMRIHRALMRLGDRTLGDIHLDQLHHKYPFMLALSQAATVHLLEKHLNQLGSHVEWGVELTHCQNVDNQVEAELKSSSTGESERIQCPWMLAADGAHSVARKSLGIPFEGTTLDSDWYLLDLPLDTTLEEDTAHAFLQDGGGFVFVVRVVDLPEENAKHPNLWRVIGSMPDPLTLLPNAKPTGPALWQSSFRISHRINDRLQEGQVYFAGDAAHVHSPIGARGMNLGIEDAWAFSKLMCEHSLSAYGEIRRTVDRRVVRRIEKLTSMVLARSPVVRMLRATAMPALTRVPMLRNRMMETLIGLDHPAMPARKDLVEQV